MAEGSGAGSLDLDEEAREQRLYFEAILRTMRQPLVVLNDPSETEGRLIYELGNGQWDIPPLRELLEDVLPENNAFDDWRSPAPPLR